MARMDGTAATAVCPACLGPNGYRVWWACACPGATGSPGATPGTEGVPIEEASRVGGELLAAGGRAEPPHGAVLLQVRAVVLLDGHAADRVVRHRGQHPEGPVFQPEDPVGDLLQAGVVADDHHAAAVLGGELAQQPGDLAAVGAVEVGGRLVGQDERRVVGQRPGDRHALLLPAGELVGAEAEAVAQPHPFEQLAGAPVGGGAGDPGEVAGQLDVLGGAERAEQVEVLEDEAEAVGAQGGQPPLGRAGEVDAVEEDGPGGGSQHRAEHQQQGGLAAARGPHDEHDLARGHAEVDVAGGADRQGACAVRLGAPADADRLGRGGHDGLLKAVAGSTRSTRRSGTTAAAAPTSSAPSPVRATLAGATKIASAGSTRPMATASSSASAVATARASATDQAAWAATIAASRPGRAPSALSTPYSRVLARVRLNSVSATTASAIAKPMPLMMRIRSALMSVTMRRSEAANCRVVCTVVPGGMASSRARSAPRSVPGLAP